MRHTLCAIETHSKLASVLSLRAALARRFAVDHVPDRAIASRSDQLTSRWARNEPISLARREHGGVFDNKNAVFFRLQAHA